MNEVLSYCYDNKYFSVLGIFDLFFGPNILLNETQKRNLKEN
jgi:hypothetical protein